MLDLLSMTETVQNTLIAAFVTIAIAYIGYLTAKLTAIGKVIDVVHTNTNSVSIKQDRQFAAARRQIALLTNKEEDIKAAEDAEKSLKENEDRQKIAAEIPKE